MSKDELLDERERELLTAFLADRNVACPRCGYNLRNLTTARCPECGDRVRLQVASVEAHLAAYTTLLVACSLAFGGSTLLALLVLAYYPLSVLLEGAGPPLLAQCLVSGVLTPIILLTRRRFRRASPARQWFLAAAACLVFFVLSVSVILLCG